jgi:hypothetical protein
VEQKLDELVATYLAIRTERDQLLRKYEADDEELKADMSQLEAVLLDACNKVSANSINTQYGTVIRKTNERYICNDWDNFGKFILINQVVELLEHRIHQGNFKKFIAENEADGLPPGVNVMREFGISVRKPSKTT